jgi:hypothetical protein
MSAATEKAKHRTAAQVAASLKALGARLVAVVNKLERAGDVPVPADAAKELTDLASAMRQAVEPAPPSATSAEKRGGGWPRDMSAPAEDELAWGHDPEVLRHG